ncbi:NAD(P)-binding protein [Aulographum hederae CBS 113979]|uniref:NAD(P)-binding protein n=1 Tax=Aulographum hederae CBS 113979 TaxID=1176131 RepID=A0A6G1GVN5_9PEZI|nr:NAD(P)-binding protein [Aulographum hederae CBS 113979]
MSSQRKLRVGIIGAGEVSQVIHLPILAMLSHLYTISAICDVSQKNADHCAEKFHIPLSTVSADEVISSKDVDIVFVLTSDEFHETYTVAALQAGKNVMLEKPITLSILSAVRIIEAERAAKGARVFVGYMRRYATSFTQAFKREVASIPKILYARVRDFSGPNAQFVAQSGTFQVRNTDFPPEASKARTEKLNALFAEAFPNKEVTPERQKYCRFLGSLGSHDISLMREILGSPDSVAGVSVNEPFYTAIFNFRNKSGEPFAATYESGIDRVPNFDAHLAVYGEDKRVHISYPSPYVKGLPIVVKVDELNEFGEMTSREVLSSYEDAYTTELQELYQCVVEGKEIKTTTEDALMDLKLYDEMYRKYDEGLSKQG